MKRLVTRFASAGVFVALVAALVVACVLPGMSQAVAFAAGSAGMAGTAGSDAAAPGRSSEPDAFGTLRASRTSRTPDAPPHALLAASFAPSQTQSQAQVQPQAQSSPLPRGSSSGSSRVSHTVPAPRLPQWAQPVPGVHVPNLYRITPTLYRSAQPSADDLAGLRALGIRKVINLRAFHRDDALFAHSGLVLQRIPIHTWDIRDQDMVTALKALRDTRRDGPVLLHCQHGADRTGVVSALYRMVYQGWTRQQAIDELRNGGYGYHPIWTNILRYLERVDVEKLRREVEATGASG